QVPSNAHWPEILALANEALITSELWMLLHDDPKLPEQVKVFLEDVYLANCIRNESLFGTLKDALSALNACGIEPALLKGCAMWAQGNAWIALSSGDRIISDLDLLVRPSEARQSVEALQLAGFAVLMDLEHDGGHAFAVLGRPQDAGSIDLHIRAPCPTGIDE